MLTHATGEGSKCPANVRTRIVRRNRSRRLAVLAVSLAAACGPRATPPRPDMPDRIAIGDATVTAPAHWHYQQHAGYVTFDDPDRAVRVTIVGDAGADPVTAIAAAWRRVEPARAHVAGTPQELPDPGDWDAVTAIDYAPRNGRIAVARWRRSGSHRFVVLVEGDRAALDRREADIDVLEGSLRVPGMREQRLGARRALDPHALDSFVQRARSMLEVPGAAIAVIVDGDVVYQRAIGVRELGKPAPITVDTRFLIGSITKPMTTLMEAALVDAGVVRWNTPVVSVLPTFALGDPVLTRELQLWHMSCACTGMPRQDLEDLFQWNGVTAEDRLATMRTMKPTTKLGETFQYSNLMVAAGGFIAAHAFAPDRPLGPAYAAAMERKVFGPIGMTSTTLDFATVERGDHAEPHALAIDGTTRAMPLSIERGVEPIAPAGGVWTTLRDMERYAAMELGDGVTRSGVRVVSAANMRERLRPRVRTGPSFYYGLGIGVGTYSGTPLIYHDGGSMGFGTTMFLLPDQRVGIIVLTNVRNGGPAEQLPFNAAVTRRIVELLFADAVPLAERKLAFYAKLHTRTPRATSTDHTWVNGVVGRYRDPALGDVVIRATATGADFDAGEWHSAIDREVDADGTVKLILLDPPFAGTPFAVGDGPSLTIPGYPGYELRRIPATTP